MRNIITGIYKEKWCHKSEAFCKLSFTLSGLDLKGYDTFWDTYHVSVEYINDTYHNGSV